MTALAALAYSALLAVAPIPATSQTAETKEPPADAFEEIVVTARKDAPPPTLDAVGYFRRYCYEPNRMTGTSASPSDDLEWEPLDEPARQRFGITDAEVPAFGLAKTSRGSALLLKAERYSRPGGLSESHCTLVVMGGDEHARLPQRLSALFGGSGTQRHVGKRDGSPRIAGWEQWLWSAMPARGSKRWREVNAGLRSGGRATWVVVANLRFYDEHDYVMGDLKTRQGPGKALSVMTLVYTTKPGAKAVR